MVIIAMKEDNSYDRCRFHRKEKEPLVLLGIQDVSACVILILLKLFCYPTHPPGVI